MKFLAKKRDCILKISEKTYLSKCKVIERNAPIRSFCRPTGNEERILLTDFSTASGTRRG